MTTSITSPASSRQHVGSLNPEWLGALIDAVYAVAITMLALEIPSEFDDEFNPLAFGNILLEYCVAFIVLFAFWVQHRRINGQVQHVSHGVLWLNAAVLLLVCLVPRATTLIFTYGDDATLVNVESRLLSEAGQPRSSIVDAVYVLVVFAADLLLLLIARVTHSRTPTPATRRLRRSKATTTLLATGCLLFSLSLPLANRYFALLLPVTLLFEEQIARRASGRD